MLSITIVSSLLLGLSLGAMWLHVRVWRSARERFDDAAALDFLGRRCRRRMQIAGLFGVLGIVLFAGHWITAAVPAAFHALGMLATLAWIVLLAVADALATRGHYYELSRRQLAEDAAEHVRLARALCDDEEKEST